jgi:hypothetical protein
LFYALKAKGLVDSKEAFFYQMDMKDLESAGSFVDTEIWENFILTPSKNVEVKPNDYTKRRK